MNTIAATTSRIPRVVLIVIVALVAAFALLMVVRSGVLGGSDSGGATATKPLPAPAAVTPAATQSHAATPAAPTTPKIVLLPGLPPSVAHALRYSKVTVVTLYVGQSAGDRASVAEARNGARAAGANFVAVNVGSDKQAATVAKFVGEVSSPATLVVRRPGKIVMQFSGPVETAVVRQAAHNAGARR